MAEGGNKGITGPMQNIHQHGMQYNKMTLFDFSPFNSLGPSGLHSLSLSYFLRMCSIHQNQSINGQLGPL